MAYELWIPPETPPETPPIDADDSYPTPAGFTTAEVVTENQLIGVNYLDPITGDPVEMNLLEGGRMNDTRRELYRAFKRLRRLLFLLIGTKNYGTIFQGENFTNFANLYTFRASGVGSTINIWWTPEDTGPAYLAHGPNGAGGAAVGIGMGVIIDNDGITSGSLGMSEIHDMVFTGATTATLYLHPGRPLNADFTGYVYLIRMYPEYEFPVWNLFPAPGDVIQCKYAVQVPGSVFSSFASVNPSAATAAGIYQHYYCVKMNEADVDLSQFIGFHGQCKNTGCPYYIALSQSVPSAVNLAEFFLARGTYTRQLQAGVSTPAQDAWKIGRDRWEGVLGLAGLNTGYDTGGLYLATKVYEGIALFEFKTGGTNADGTMAFEHLGDTAGALDDVGMLSLFAAAAAKKDAAGGLLSGAGALIENATRTPGYRFETRTGARRMGSIGRDESSVAVGAEHQVQRVKKRHYVSGDFALDPESPANLTVDNPNGETRVQCFATPQTYKTGTTYTIKFSVPRMCEKATAPGAGHAKTIVGTVATASISGNLLTVDFTLGKIAPQYPAGPTDPPTTQSPEADCGGNVVCGENAWENTNPGCPGIVGDRQRLLYPGDKVTFAVGANYYSMTCLSAVAFGGSAQNAATAPDSDAPGLSAKVVEDFYKRDQAIFALEGKDAEAIRAAGDAAFVGATIYWAGHGAVAPPTFDYTSTATGYAPVIQKVIGGVATTIETGLNWDPTAGIAYIDASAWGAGTYRLEFTGWVFDDRKTYPCEIPAAMHKAIDDLCGGYVSPTVNGAAYYIQLSTVSDQAHADGLDVNVWSQAGVTWCAPEVPTPPDSVPPLPWVTHAGWDDFGRSQLKIAYPRFDEELQEYVDTIYTDWREAQTVYDPGGNPCFIGGILSGIVTPLPDGAPAVPGYFSSNMFQEVMPLRAWTAAEITQAYVDISMTGVTISHSHIRWGDCGEYIYEFTSNLDDEYLAVVAAVLDFAEDGMTVTMTLGGYTPNGTLKKTVTEGVVSYAGTLDATAMLKSLAGWTDWASGRKFGLVVIGPNGLGTVGAGAQQLAASWITKYQMNYDEDHVNTGTELEVSNVTFGGLSFSNWRIQPNAAALDDGADMHTDHEKQACPPDLLYEPPA